jgi:hypothetical protein
MARDQFDLLRPAGNTDKFVHADARLHSDGTFTAELNYGGNLIPQSGKWELKGERLTLTDLRGNSQVFLARSPDAKTLLVTVGIKGSDVTLTLKKQ